MPQPSSQITPPQPSIGWQAPLIDLCLALVRRRSTVAACLFVAIALGAVKYLSTPHTYRSSAVAILLPREKPIFDVAVDSGNLETRDDGAKRENTGALMLPANPELYTTLIRSRSVLQDVATEHQDRLLAGMSGRTRSEELIGKLRSMIRVEASEQGLMTVTVTASDPELSAELANALIGAGEIASKDIERQLVLQQSHYIDQSLMIARTSLGEHTDRLKAFTRSHSVIDPINQASDHLRQIRELTQKRDDLARQLASRQLTWRDRDSEVQRLRLEVQLCNQQMADLQSAVAGEIGAAEYAPLMVDYEALAGMVRLQGDLVVSLSAKSELLRIRAEQPAGSIAVVRPAATSDRPVGPSRKAFLGISLGLGLMVGVSLALFQEQWCQAKRDPYMVDRLKQFPALKPRWILSIEQLFLREQRL